MQQDDLIVNKNITEDKDIVTNEEIIGYLKSSEMEEQSKTVPAVKNELLVIHAEPSKDTQKRIWGNFFERFHIFLKNFTSGSFGENLNHFKNLFPKKFTRLNTLAIACGAILAIITVFYLYSFGSGQYIGIAEATSFPQISKVSSEILNIPIGVGQEVESGDVLATLDKSSKEYELSDLKLSLEKMQTSLKDSKLADSTVTAENSTVMVAEAKYNQAVSIANQASQDYADALVMFSEGNLSQGELDQFNKVSEDAFTAVDTAQKELNAAKNSAGTASLAIDIEKTQNKINQLTASLLDYEIVASHSGKITKINNVVGDVVKPGTHIIELSTTEEMYLVLPMTTSLKNKLSYGKIVKFAYGDFLYTGKVKYLSDKKVKISIPTNCKIKPGEKAELVFKK